MKKGKNLRPPICKICGLTEDCDIVTFKKTKNQEELEKQHSPDLAFNLPNQEWFCKMHFEVAKRYSSLTVNESLEKIKKDTK